MISFDGCLDKLTAPLLLLPPPPCLENKMHLVLLRLLAGTLLLLEASEIWLQVGNGVQPSNRILDNLPSLADSWRGTLVGEHGIDPGGRVGDHGLHERALRVARAEEPEVDDEQQPASTAEGQGGENQSDQQRELQGGHHGHAGVVVCLDETADLVC